MSENWAKSICNVCVHVNVCACIGERKARCRKQEAKETATHTTGFAAVCVSCRHTQTADDVDSGSKQRRSGGSSSRSRSSGVNFVAVRNNIRAFGF